MKTLLLTISLLIYNLVLFGQDIKTAAYVLNTVSDSIINFSIEPGDPVISSLAKKESADRFANMAPGLLVSPIQTTESQAFVIDAYSMPSSYMLYIQVEGNEITELRFSLFDNTGKFIKQQKLGSINTELSLEGYPAGKYIIKIVHAMKDMKTFEVYKK